jgi:hypothetical protein
MGEVNPASSRGRFLHARARSYARALGAAKNPFP